MRFFCTRYSLCTSHVMIAAVLLVLLLHIPCLATALSPPILEVVQRAAPDGGTRSVVFLSSGYLEEEKSEFLSDVKTVISALSNYSTGIISDPWPRYASFMNFYSLFQASETSGLDSNQNNLGCSLGVNREMVLVCDVPSIVSLASYAPSVDIILVLVNSKEKLGNGGNGIAVVTNQVEYLPVLSVHYLNRAIANLAEEYSEGYKGDVPHTLPNCATSNGEATERWSYWYDILRNKGSSDSLRGSGCTYSNLVAPTSDLCLMRNTKLNVMCPICREAVNLALFLNGVSDGYALQPSTAPINIAASQCPPPYHTVVTSGTVVLYAGDFAMQNGVTVNWYDANGELLGEGAYLVPSSSVLSGTPTYVKAVIVDNSPYVQPSKRSTLSNVVTFSLVSSAPSGVTATKPACYDSLSSPPAAGTAPSFCPSGVTCDEATPSPDKADNYGEGEVYVEKETRSKDFFIPVVICGSLSVVLWCVITGFFFTYFRLAPREVLDITTPDLLLVIVISVLLTVVWLFAIFTVGVANSKRRTELVVYLPVSRTALVTCSITLGLCALNYISVLLRWYIACAACAITGAAIGIVLFIFGVFSILGTAASSSDQFQTMLQKRWAIAADGAESFLCPFQRTYRCSGFHSSCFEIDSTSCTATCNANFYMEPCAPFFTKIFKKQYSPLDALSAVVSCLLILIAALDAIYYMRFRQISANGKFCRSFRTDPQPPVLPITYNEANRARRCFANVTRKTGGKLEGAKAIDFLECIFANTIEDEEREQLMELGPLNFDELMLFYFPYAQTSQMDPRMLTPDEAEGTSEMLQLERKQYKRLDEFEEASGCLSPEALQNIFQEKFSKIFMPDKESILEEIRKAAKNCPDAPMCRGLSREELEGLRGLWVAVHPSISGCITDPELEILYNFTHDDHCNTAEKLAAWRTKLDIRDNDKKVGWAEFCYPFAQRALLRDAREYLRLCECEVPVEVVPKDFVVKKFGPEILSAFLPYENEIPIERLLTTIMRRWSDHPLREKSLFTTDIYHSTELHSHEEVRWDKKKRKKKEKED